MDSNRHTGGGTAAGGYCRRSTCARLPAGKGALLLALLCLQCLVTVAQAATAVDWRRFQAVRGYSLLTGSSGPGVRNAITVAEDVRGRIWVGDYAGLTRLDGDLVTRYDGSRTEGMAEGYIHATLPLANGDMLVGGDREGLLYWQLASDSFQRVPLHDGGPYLTRVNAITASVAGGAWVAAEQGLFHWSGGRIGELTPVATDGLDGLDSRRVFDVLEHADGSLWVAAHPGIYRRAPGSTRFTPVHAGDPVLDARLAGEAAWVLEADGHGAVWAGMMRSGVVVMAADGRSARAPAGLDGIDGLQQGHTIRSLLWRDGRMWAGTDGVGLLVIDSEGARRQTVNLSAFQAERNFQVRGLTAAADGRIWVASSRGVFHFDPRPGAVYELDASLSGGLQLVSNTVVALHIDPRQRMWLGMESGMVQMLDPASGERRVVRLPAPLDSSYVAAIGSDDSGRIWVIGNGVAWIDPDSLQVEMAGEVSAGTIRRYSDITFGPGRAWLAHYEGLTEVDMRGRVLRRMADTRAGLLTTRVHSVVHVSGRLWVGTAEGLQRVDLASWSAHPVALGGAQGALPENRYIGSLGAQADMVWAGTLEGISHGPADAAGKLPLLLATDGREVRGLAADARGGLWFTVKNRGIGYRSARGEVRMIGARDGLHPDTTSSRDEVALAADGTLAVASETGVVMVAPQMLTLPPTTVPDLSPRLMSVSLDGQPMPPAQLPAPGKPLLLDRQVERVVMAFSALDYTAADLRRYSYRLEGLDSRWIEVSGEVPLVFYSRLPVGQYTLLLRTTSEEFPGREWVTRLELQVPPAWYQRVWVWLVAGLSLIGLVGGGLDLRLRRARAREQRLQDMVSERTEALSLANARLAQLAGEDALTGLSNRRRAFERMAELHAWRQRMVGSDCVVLMDLDHFKQTNDRYGHLGGDAVLRSVGELLRVQLRTIDVAARYGGEELLLVLIDTGLEDGQNVVARLAQALRALRVPFNGQQIEVRASFGIAASDPAQPFEQWIERADAALYRAKREGRDRICVDGR